MPTIRPRRAVAPSLKACSSAFGRKAFGMTTFGKDTFGETAGFRVDARRPGVSKINCRNHPTHHKRAGQASGQGAIGMQAARLLRWRGARREEVRDRRAAVIVLKRN